MAKGKLRHLAISVPDKEKAAKFYEETFGFERVSHSRVATTPDGVMNLMLLQFQNQNDAGDEHGKDSLACITSGYGSIIILKR
jgi:catechol 2,3-dioxygenase-like lactoylglutathione lyase family enzyme